MARYSINIGLGLVFTILLAIPLGNLADEGRDRLLEVALALVTCVAALLRERTRLGAAIAGIGACAVVGPVARIADLPHEPGPAATVALFVLVGAAIRVVPVPAAAGVAAGVVVFPLGWLTLPASGSVITQLGVGVVGWCGAVGTGLWLRSRDHHRDSTTATVRRDERLALARELHDLVAHHITGVVLQTQAARIVARKQPDALDETLLGIETAGTAALADMRRVVGLLRDTGDDIDEGVSTAAGPEQLAELVRRFGGRGPTVELTMPEGDVPLPPELTSTVYRIVQESLTNIARHAPAARSVTVDIAHCRDGVTVRIVDDAPAGAHRHPRRGGYGLVGMRERVEALGGTLRAGPRPDAGWSVQARLPLPAREPR